MNHAFHNLFRSPENLDIRTTDGIKVNAAFQQCVMEMGAYFQIYRSIHSG